MQDKQDIVKAFADFIDTHFGASKRVPEEKSVEIVKAVNEDKKQALFVALYAHPDDSSFDLHNDTYDSEEVEKACHGFNEHCMKANIAHFVMVDDSVVKIVESYVTMTDIQLDEQFISKGSWLQTWKFNDGQLWEGVKSGEWNGLSIQCLANTETINE